MIFLPVGLDILVPLNLFMINFSYFSIRTQYNINLKVFASSYLKCSSHSGGRCEVAAYTLEAFAVVVEF